MALLFLDSFDHYATGDLGKKWVRSTSETIDSAITATGRTSNALSWTNSTGFQANLSTLVQTPIHGVSGTTSIVGFALKISDPAHWNQGNQGRFLDWYDGALYKCGVKLNDDGTWSFGSNTTASTYTSSGVPILAATWQYVEFKVLLHDTAGTFELKVNGTSVLTLSGIDTIQSGAAAWTSVGFFRTSFSVNVIERDGYIYIDDFYLLDGTTGTGRANNDFWGDTTIRYLIPNADTATKDWSRSAGSDNYALVDETSPDDDTTYISTDTVDATDLYDFPAVTSGAEVTGVQAVISAKKGDTGSAQVAAVVNSGATTEEHPSPLGIASDSAYSYFLFPWDGDPNAGPGEWTESSVNALKAGPRKTG